MGSDGMGGRSLPNLILERLGRRLSKGDCAALPWSPSFLRLVSNGPFFSVSMRPMTFSLPLAIGLIGSAGNGSLGAKGTLATPSREPTIEGALSLNVGVALPEGVPGRLPLPALAGPGNGGKAQSNEAESSGLGGRGSNSRGAGLVALRMGGGRLPPLLLAADRALGAGERGESDRGGRGAKNGVFAASGLIRGGGGRTGFGAGIWLEVSVGARILVFGTASETGSLCCCSGEGACGMCP